MQSVVDDFAVLVANGLVFVHRKPFDRVFTAHAFVTTVDCSADRRTSHSERHQESITPWRFGLLIFGLDEMRNSLAFPFFELILPMRFYDSTRNLIVHNSGEQRKYYHVFGQLLAVAHRR